MGSQLRSGLKQTAPGAERTTLRSSPEKHGSLEKKEILGSARKAEGAVEVGEGQPQQGSSGPGHERIPEDT